VVWNLLVSALAVGSAIVLYDGNPASPDLATLWKLGAETESTFFGGSAGFYLACRKAGIVPREVADTSSIRTVVSTGAPLSPDGFRWVYEAVGSEVFLCVFEVRSKFSAARPSR